METVGADAVLVDRDGPVHVVSINLASQRNALDLAQRVGLTQALRASIDDVACRAIVLCGEGPVFCAGGDVRSMGGTQSEADERLWAAAELAETIIMSDKPVVAAVQGGAYGLGLALAAACDYVVAATDAGFVASFGRIGLGPDSAISWSLPRRVGMAHASRILLWAERIDADEAQRIGLVDELVDVAAVREKALERARRVLGLAAGSVAAVKSLLRSTDVERLRDLIEDEVEWQQQLFGTADFREGRAAFLARRSPVFDGGTA